MRACHKAKFLGGSVTLLLALAVAGCQQGAVTETANTNTNATTANANVNTNSNVNTNAAPASTAMIETREPERYRANVVFTQAEVSGSAQQKSASLPQIQVARSGADRRYAINLPAVGEVIFLDRADKRYLVLPSRKQYVELSKEMTGFDVRSLTPGQMVAQLQKQPGMTRVGDDTVNGRGVVKYRYATTAQTGTQAGDVQSESFIYVDNETGLPLKVEGYGQASGNVRGMSSGKVTVEMRDIQTEVEPALFELPQGYTQITQDEIKQQLQMLSGLFQVLMSNMNAQGNTTPSGTPASTPATATPSPTASASPSATVR